MESGANPPKITEWIARIGVSSCLLGEEVRYDGGHKRDAYIVDTLSRWIEWAPVCPEVEIGLSVPRPSIRLVEDGDGGRLVDPKSGEDHTGKMAALAPRRVGEMVAAGLDGFILKRASPSCGMERVKVWGTKGLAHKRGVGHFARHVLELAPALPVEEEGRLNDLPLRDHFVERIFCRNRWRVLLARGLSRARLVAFHTAHKMLLRAHDESGYGKLGRLVGEFGQRPDAELFEAYQEGFVETLDRRATVRKHVNVLQHIMGYLKDELGAPHKRQLLLAIEDYRAGILPLNVPLTLLRYEIETREIDYVRGQLYLEPHPKELMLRNLA